MNSKLKLIIILFFIFLLAFIGGVLVSEYINMNKIRTEYPDLPENAYNLRKDSLKVWAIRLVLQFLIPLLF
ncbi:hypothetical protein ACF3M2_20035 [Tissierella carlieri]